MGKKTRFKFSLEFPEFDGAKVVGEFDLSSALWEPPNDYGLFDPLELMARMREAQRAHVRYRILRHAVLDFEEEDGSNDVSSQA